MILLGGLVAGLAVSPTYGQSGEEYVLDIDIRVKAEASPEEMQVRLIRRGDVLTEKTTNERGVVDFSVSTSPRRMSRTCISSGLASALTRMSMSRTYSSPD